LGLTSFGFSDLPDFQQYFSYIVVVSFIGVSTCSILELGRYLYLWTDSPTDIISPVVSVSALPPPTCRMSPTNFITQFCIEYTSPERVSLMVIGTDCCVNRLSNYQVSISDKADFSTHAYQQDFHVAPNPKKTITLDAPGKQGRYVRIQLLDETVNCL
jgi:hypothetical protein